MSSQQVAETWSQRWRPKLRLKPAFTTIRVFNRLPFSDRDSTAPWLELKKQTKNRRHFNSVAVS